MLQHNRRKTADTTILEMSPMQWTNLQDIDDITPLNADDYECLAEVREVLKKHHKRDRFGVALLHKHFDVGDNEVLMETSDKVNRVLTIKPYDRSADVKGIETVWKLLDGDMEAMTWCKTKCTYGVGGHKSEEDRM